MVDEQKTTTQETATGTTENTGEGNINTTTSLIDRADALRKGLEETETRIKGHIDRFESLAARVMLSGKSDAGQVNKTPEQTQKEEVDRQAAEIAKRFKR